MPPVNTHNPWSPLQRKPRSRSPRRVSTSQRANPGSLSPRRTPSSTSRRSISPRRVSSSQRGDRPHSGNGPDQPVLRRRGGRAPPAQPPSRGGRSPSAHSDIQPFQALQPGRVHRGNQRFPTPTSNHSFPREYHHRRNQSPDRPWTGVRIPCHATALPTGRDNTHTPRQSRSPSPARSSRARSPDSRFRQRSQSRDSRTQPRSRNGTRSRRPRHITGKQNTCSPAPPPRQRSRAQSPSRFTPIPPRQRSPSLTRNQAQPANHRRLRHSSASPDHRSQHSQGRSTNRRRSHSASRSPSRSRRCPSPLSNIPGGGGGSVGPAPKPKENRFTSRIC